MAPKPNQVKMSVTPLPTNSRSTKWRSLLVATMAIVVVSLQIGLPWLSYELVYDPNYNPLQALKDPRGFWERRLSFDRFLNPQPEVWSRQTPCSTAICDHELIVIWNPNLPSSTTDRIDLRTGRVTSSPTPHDIVSVPADGPSLPPINVDSNWGDVLLWEGRPVRFQRQNLHETDATEFTWLEGNVISKLSGNPSKDEPKGRVWTRLFEDGRSEDQFVTLPVRARRTGFDYAFHPVTSTDGSIYFVRQNWFDQRWTVLRWDNGRFQSVLDQRSPLLGLTCIDAASLMWLAFVIPMFVLWCLSALVQARMPHPSRIAEQEALASVSRRGLARVIDVASWGLPLLLAFVLHPEAIDWWSDLTESWTSFKWAATAVFSQPSWGSLLDLRKYLFAEIQLQFPVPVLRPLADIAIAIFLVQAIWQCVSGQTLGKWLAGIKVVRSDLRRCSWGRSCLREALFFVDTLLLLSWVPGVVSILLTSKSQRIGDWVTDTVVVRIPADAKSAENAEA